MKIYWFIFAGLVVVNFVAAAIIIKRDGASEAAAWITFFIAPMAIVGLLVIGLVVHLVVFLVRSI